MVTKEEPHSHIFFAGRIRNALLSSSYYGDQIFSKGYSSFDIKLKLWA